MCPSFSSYCFSADTSSHELSKPQAVLHRTRNKWKWWDESENEMVLCKDTWTGL